MMTFFKATRVLLLLLALLAGCSRPPQEDPVEITLMHGWGGVARDHVAMRAIYEDFQKGNPDIRLLFDASPDISVVLEKADDMLAVDRMPDIVSTNGFGSFVANAVSRGKALDLAPYIAEDPGFAANISGNVLETWSNADGHIFTLPDVIEVMGCWYNEGILREAGVTDDGTATGRVAFPATYEGMEEVCGRIASWAGETGSAVVPVIMDPHQAKALLGARIAAGSEEGADFMRARRDGCSPDDLEAALGDVRRFYSYYKGVLPRVNDTRQFFFSGKSAFYFNGVWANIELASTDSPPDVRCAPFPGMGGGTVAYVSSSSGYVIGNTGSPRKTGACVRFLKYMLSDDVQQRIVLETRQVPSSPHVPLGLIAQRVPELGRALEACYQADIHILALDTILKEESVSRLMGYLQQPGPGETGRGELIADFTRRGPV